MRDRAAGIGAKLDITSASGQGTRVSLSVPLGEPAVREEVEMSAEVKSWLQKASALAVGGAGCSRSWRWLCAQGLVPRAGGRQHARVGAALSVAWLLALRGGWAGSPGRVARGRGRCRVTVAVGADSPAVWRMRREISRGRGSGSALAAMVILPGALMPKSWPQYPVAALAVGLACAVVAAVTIAQSYRATEGYWARLVARRPGR